MIHDNTYKLIDTGNKRKLESYAGYIMDRPDPQALWPKTLSNEVWKKVDAFFQEDNGGKRESRGRWIENTKIDKDLTVDFYNDLKCRVKLNPFKHTGIFPEQYENWVFINKVISENIKEKKEIKVLNLFGYTGCASIVAVRAGAHITHVDGSKQSIAGVKENMSINNISEENIRYILDDAYSFVKREIRRGVKYDGIMMDPPSFGHGPDREVWKIDEMFIDFINDCKKLLSDKPLFFIVSGYSSGYSHLAYRYNLEDLITKYGGEVQNFELTIKDGQDKLLPSGIVARWTI